MLFAGDTRWATFYKQRMHVLTPKCAFAAVLALGLCATFGRGAAAPNRFATPLSAEDLDRAAFTEWVDGKERSATPADGPRHVVWTRDSAPEWDGIKFGESKTPGMRTLRIGWRKSLRVGTVLARGGGALSVLKPTVVYPGRPDVEEDWLAAERVQGREVGRGEAGTEEFALWVLPPGTETRALRFTHRSGAAEKTYAGWLGGVYVLGDRWANVAPQAQACASGHDEAAFKLNNDSNDELWAAWDNAPETNAPPVSPEHPAWVMLSWPAPIRIAGLNLLWAGFTAVEVQTYLGTAETHPREGSDSDWKTIGTWDQMQNQYPRALAPNWVDFGEALETRALRVRMTRPIDETRSHGHLKGKSKGGRRVWLGELQALQALDSGGLASSILAGPRTVSATPPIPIRIHLPEAGFVTVVIDDTRGRRVRNLESETPLPGGDQVVWWDGMDDLRRDPEAYRHGLNYLPPEFVAPGKYRAYGLWRKGIDLRYEFSLYNAGSPAWETADGTGAWLANHTPPCAAVFVPASRAPGGRALVYLGSFVSEGGHGLAWVDLEGRKQGGVGWVGGSWTGAAFLARDDGPQADTNTAAYAAAPWSVETYLDRAKDKRGEVRLTAITRDGMKPVYRHVFTPSFAKETAPGATGNWFEEMGGLAVYDGVIAFGLTKIGQIVLLDSRNTNHIATNTVPDPHGLAFDRQGKLLALSGNKLLRFSRLDGNLQLASEATLIPATGGQTGLEAPRQIALDSSGNIYISDQGRAHQVKVFSPDGGFIRAVGRAGEPAAGPYDPVHINHPEGLTIDGQDRLWVTEDDFQPKRVSVWSVDGRFIRAFYGPSEYGGGGKLDPEDKTKFYYHGMEFRLDWERGADQLVNVFYRPEPGDGMLPDGYGSTGVPEQPHYINGRRYWSNDHSSNPTGGPSIAMLWKDVDGVARPVAALGRANDWKLLRGEALKALWPQGVNLNGDYWPNACLFAWSDLNGDGRVETNEVAFQKVLPGSVSVAPDLSFVVSRIGTNAMRYAPARFTAQGAPVYDLAKPEVLAAGTQSAVSSGGDQALWHPGGWTVLTTPPEPFSPYSLGAVFKGEPRWSYPNPWPGLHASHESAPPGKPGDVVGATRLLGDFITPPHSDAGPVWCVNGNMGNMYLFTVDGLFVAELFKDVRRGPTWSMPGAQRGMLLNGLTLHDENFWPSITQTRDGRVYLVDGARSSLVRVDGLESIRRLPAVELRVNAEDLGRARAYFLELESARQKDQGLGWLKVALRATAPDVDGKLEDWPSSDWVEVDKAGTAAWFDSTARPYDVRGALAVAGGRLYGAFRTGDERLLENSGAAPNALFKTGGALDVMLGTNPRADENRRSPAPGDIRLMIARVHGRTVALLYRAVVPGATEPVAFSSPWRTVHLDSVEDVSSQVQLAADKGNFEFSIPLAVLGWKPEPGVAVRGDLGILRGNGFQTLQRVYWSNKATGITADVPSEAELTPQLWGKIKVVKE
jgi:hypothetical protein